MARPGSGAHLPTMRRWLPETLLEVVARALELDLLTHRLDLDTANALATCRRHAAHRCRPLRRAYVASGTRGDREEQLRLLLAVGTDSIDSRQAGARHVAQTRARAGQGRGLSRMQGFLEAGFNRLQGHGP